MQDKNRQRKKARLNTDKKYFKAYQIALLKEKISNKVKNSSTLSKIKVVTCKHVTKFTYVQKIVYIKKARKID